MAAIASACSVRIGTEGVAMEGGVRGSERGGMPDASLDSGAEDEEGGGTSLDDGPSGRDAGAGGRDASADADAEDGAGLDANTEDARPDPCDGPCDDGNPCTEADHCVSGVCTGSPRSSAAAVLGTVSSFGSDPALETVVAFPSQERAVFLTGSTLTLLSIAADRMEVLDRATWGSTVKAFSISPSVWVSLPGTFIVPLSAERIAVIGSDWSIDLYDIGQDKLQPSYRYGFGSGGQQNVQAVLSQGNALWTCIGNWVQRYSLDDVHAQLVKDPGFSLPTTDSCFGLALSPDGSSLLAATSNGLDVLDISSNDGSGVFRQRVLEGHFLLDAYTNGRDLGLYELASVTSGTGRVISLDAATLQTRTTYAGTSQVMPVGFTVLGSGLLLEQEDDRGCRAYGASLFASGLDGSAGSTFVPLAACRAHYGTLPAHMAGAGALADLPPTHQVVRVDTTSLALVPVRARAQGSFSRVRPAGLDLVEVHGPTSMHLVDIAEPSMPVVRDGGLLVPMSADWLRVEVSSTGEASILTVADSDLGWTGPRTSLYWTTEGALPTIAGSIANDVTDAQWAAAGRFLLEASPSGISDFRLRRFAVSSLSRVENQSLTPELDQVLSSMVPAALDERQGLLVRADPASGDVVIAEERGDTANMLPTSTILSWYVADDNGYRAAFSKMGDPGNLVDLGLHGGRAALLLPDRVLLVAGSGALAASYVAPAGEIERLLSFDDQYLYVAASFQDASSHITHGVLVLRAGDLSVADRYVLPEPVLSSAVVGNHLVFGMASTLAVAAPVCGE